MLATLILCSATLAAPPAPENFYRDLNVGDWVEFKSINHAKETVISRQSVVAKTGEEIVMKLAQSINGKSGPDSEHRVSLKEPFDPEASLKALEDVKVEMETLGSGKETLTVAGKSYDCQWEKKKTTFSYSNPMIPKTEIVSKRWWSNDVPFGGTVKVESTIGGTMTVTELAGFGKGK